MIPDTLEIAIIEYPYAAICNKICKVMVYMVMFILFIVRVSLPRHYYTRDTYVISDEAFIFWLFIVLLLVISIFFAYKIGKIFTEIGTISFLQKENSIVIKVADAEEKIAKDDLRRIHLRDKWILFSRGMLDDSIYFFRSGQWDNPQKYWVRYAADDQRMLKKLIAEVNNAGEKN